MTKDYKAIWIKTGYDFFAVNGKDGLKVERLAKTVGKSKSSFYHHFADIELFTGYLLEYHIKQSHIIAESERKADCIDPDLINIFIKHKADLFFNRQLRINRNIKRFSETLQESNKIVGSAFINVWVKDLSLNLTQNQIEGIFTLALENFFLQINSENFTVKWLSGYFKNLKEITKNFN